MRFSSFIKDNLDAILEEWDAFARTLFPAGKAISNEELRDHCRAVLTAIAEDMETEQTEEGRAAKAKRMHREPEAETAASSHGAMRQTSGFNFVQLVGEFRAMRASVLRLWSRADAAGASRPAAEEIARFNEALDQALAESVERYTADAAESREMFLAVLGHDVRSPLGSIRLATDVLVRPALPEQMRVQVGLRIRRASDIISRLTADLLEYARSRLSRGIPVELEKADLRPICEDALDVVRTSHPEREFVQHLSGNLQVDCDVPRIQQLLSNLLNNAVQHGDTTRPVSLEAVGEADAVVLKITNFGTPIPVDAHDAIFEPLVAAAALARSAQRASANKSWARVIHRPRDRARAPRQDQRRIVSRRRNGVHGRAAEA